MSVARSCLCALAFTLTALAPALAVDTSMQIVIELAGDAERVVTRYECDGLEPFEVEYVNAAPVFLAFLPVDGDKLIFVNVISGSGARYVSGAHEWWTRGGEATLTDVTADEAGEPTSCLEMIDTP